MDTEKKIFVRPIIPVLFSYIGGIVTGLHVPPVPGLLWVLCGLCLFSLFAATKRRTTPFVPLVLFFVLGSWNLQSRAAPRLPPNHIANFIDGRYWHIIGTVKDPPQQRLDQTRFVVQAESLTRGEQSFSITGGVRITVQGHIESLEKGDRIACLARLKKLWNFNNPGGFDYRRHMAFRGVWASAFVSKEQLLIKLHTTDRGWIGKIAHGARAAVSELIESLPPQEARAVLKALVTGDRSEVSPRTDKTLRQIGGAHLLAISGLHIGMIATLAFFVFRVLLSCSERILLAAWSTRGAALLSAGPVLFYGFLAGMSPSTQRAVIMTMAFLIALVLERERDAINTLAIAALVILVNNPTALFHVSFQLSFAAVFSILYVLKNLSCMFKFRNPPHRGLKRLALFLVVSTTAVLGTLPVTLYYFNQVSLIGPVTNCLMIPLVGFLVVPLGLLAVVFLMVSQTVSLLLMKGALLVMQGGLMVAEQFARIPFAAVKTVTPSLLEIGLYYTLAWTLMKLGTTKRAKIAISVVLLVTLADATYWFQKRLGRDNLAITAIDVGRGQAVLIEMPGGKCMLVDGGGFYENRFDVGERIVAPLLWQKKIATVETLILSHPHPDHLNGLLFVARHFHVRELWTNEDVIQSPQHQDLLDMAKEQNIAVLGMDKLAKPQVIGDVVFEVLLPPTDFLERKKRDRWRTTNNNSLVVKVTLGRVSFLFPGDIEAEAESELAALAGEYVNSDVLMAPHHGSKTSSTARLLHLANPTVVVISSGKESPGLPHQKVLDRYKAHGCRIFRTDLHGAISLITNGTDLKVEPYLTDTLSFVHGQRVSHIPHTP
jgi:competence protein ComEC